jgi:hypothetical protein
MLRDIIPPINISRGFPIPNREAGSAGGPGTSDDDGLRAAYRLKLADLEPVQKRRGVLDLWARLRGGGSLAGRSVRPTRGATLLPRPHR